MMKTATWYSAVVASAYMAPSACGEPGASPTPDATGRHRDDRGRSTRCVPTVTVRELQKAEHGCHVDCSGEFCIEDRFVTLPCGCRTADHVVTKTTTVCPTAPCWSCHTGFPFTTTADCAGATTTTTTTSGH
ncbi:hypothetical protein CDD83_6677 [Cordyceps sp. RAO-2017]|nr:hypothetical protein CDD83_6677 [Cordyceps sp. RAO-2017]